LRELRRAGIGSEARRVWTEAGLREALLGFDPEVVLSDHSLPGFGAHDVLRVVHAEHPDTPVIVVTGTLDEATAVEYLTAGAVDYIVKDRLYRLVGSVRRALQLRRAQAEAARASAALRQLQEQHHQAQKMEALGRLAGGVAHDFNNLLTVITVCCDLALEGLAPDSSIRSDLLEAREAAGRAAGLTRQLLAFSRKQAVAPQQIDLNALVGRMAGMLGRLLGSHVTVELATAPQVGQIWADPGRVEQIVMNLSVNAGDAMPLPQGGRLTLATRDAEVDEATAASAGVNAGPYVEFAVTDTGMGMDTDTKAHLFEPFFTTKPKGKGTGLGLATVYGVVQQAGGFILVDSEVGKGSTFRVYLPRVT